MPYSPHPPVQIIVPASTEASSSIEYPPAFVSGFSTEAPTAPSVTNVVPENKKEKGESLEKILEKKAKDEKSSSAVRSSSLIEALVNRALSATGIPYRWGGTSLKGFDCSGLMQWVFKGTVGVDLPRVSREQANIRDGKKITSFDKLERGDLVFFKRGGQIHHVGLYLGSGNMLHAPRTGKRVGVENISEGYFRETFSHGMRIFDIARNNDVKNVVSHMSFPSQQGLQQSMNVRINAFRLAPEVPLTTLNSSGHSDFYALGAENREQRPLGSPQAKRGYTR